MEIGWKQVDEKTTEYGVRDNGIGIEPQYTKQIFQIFKRLHTKKAYPDTGIGLSIVEKAVRVLSGSIRVESESDKGSTFSAVLPNESKEVNS